jgi:hypothetical protein
LIPSILFGTAMLLQVVSPAAVPDSASAHRMRHRNGREARSAVAAPTERAPRVDGRLDDEVWANAELQRGFRRDVPSDGRPAAQETEVRVLYDRDALYIGARLGDDKPHLVSRRLNRRDSFSNFNDVFFVMIDSYHDHRTTFIFGVTPAGERRDAIQSGDGAVIDASWDPVWTAVTRIDSLGWVAEMRIPFSQLRFPRASEQVFGIQFRRDIVRAGEAVDWNWSPRTDPGTTSKYGHLLGLRDVPAPRRLEVLPYVSSQAQLTEGADGRNPFDDGSVTSGAVGLDLKYGATSDLTLTATVNPDFGQVEADPSVVNLTAFESFFEERRPFFVEGANIFDFGASIGQGRFFYSRRIGRAPTLSAAGSGAYVDVPSATSILGAAKLTGRTQSGWTIGAVQALTGREVARRADVEGVRGSELVVEPMTNYAALRVRRENAHGSNGVGFFASSVNRRLDDAVQDSLASSAYTGGVDFYHRFARNAYQLTGWLGGSVVSGTAPALTSLQLRSSRYYQRPDQDHVDLDSNRTSLGGLAGYLKFEKAEGAVFYKMEGSFLTPGLELNDAGFLTQTDRGNASGQIGRRWVAPGRVFQSKNVYAIGRQSVNFGGTNVERAVGAGGTATTLGFTSFNVAWEYLFRALSDRETRGGPLLQTPAAHSVYALVQTDSRKLISLGLEGRVRQEERGGTQLVAGTLIRLQPQARFDAEVVPSYQRVDSKAFYVTQVGDPVATATFGRRYVFGDLLQQTVSASLRLNVYFTPSLTLQTYAQPFVATGAYGGFKEVADGKRYAFNRYGAPGGTSTIALGAGNRYVVEPDGAGPAAPFTFGNPDFRIRSLRSNVVMRWEYHPGSTLFLVWNQSGQNVGSDPRFRALRDLSDVFDVDMRNVFLIKVNRYFSF